MDGSCVVCGNSFPRIKGANFFRQKYCSTQCQSKNGIIRSKFKKSGISTGTVGAIGEVIITTDLLKRGFDVFRAISPASNFDLVGFREGKVFTFEVRTGYFRKDKLLYPKYPKDKASYYAIIVHEPQEKIFYFPEL